MNNEEKILPQNEEVNTDVNAEAGGEKAKKLPTGALIGIIAGAVAIVVAIVLLVVLLGGNKCEHIDANDDYLCDKCGEHFDDGDEEPVTPDVVTADVTFTIVLDNGETLSGINFTVQGINKDYNLVSGSDGKVVQTLPVGAYGLSYENSVLPQYCTPDTFGFKVEEGTTSVEIKVVDNTPDGSREKPFFISEDETEIALAPGEELYFNYRGSSVKYIKVNNSGAIINYNGESYLAGDEAEAVLVTPEIGDITVFSVKNNTDTEFTAVLLLKALPGSNENPYELVGNSGTVSVSEEQTVYYKWIAEKSGVLVLTSQSDKNNITLTKVLENDIPVITQTAGSIAAYFAVSAGEEILIGVSAIGAEEAVDIDFTLSIYQGNEAEPVPVLVDEMYISMGAGEGIVFSAESGKTVVIADDENASIIYNGTEYTSDEYGVISVTLTEETCFKVVNNGDNRKDIYIEIN